MPRHPARNIVPPAALALLAAAIPAAVVARAFDEPETRNPEPPLVQVQTRDGQTLGGRLERAEDPEILRFRTEDGRALPLDELKPILFPRPESPRNLPPGAPRAPFRAMIGHDERFSGRLVSLDQQRLLMLPEPPLDPARPVEIRRAGLRALGQRPGETLVVEDGFEESAPRWRLADSARVVGAPVLAGQSALRLASPAGSASLALDEPIPAGRVEIAFRDDSPRAPNRKWHVELVFASGDFKRSLQAVLGWNEEHLGARGVNLSSVAVQRLPREGRRWRSLVFDFNGRSCQLAVDGRELAHVPALDGALVEIRAVAEMVGPSPSPALPDSEAFLDNLRVVRYAAPPARFDTDPEQDDARMVEGDQLFGAVRSADLARVLLDVADQPAPVPLPWARVSGLRFRSPARIEFDPAGKPLKAARDALGLPPVRGLLARLEWFPDPSAGPRDLDRCEAAVVDLLDDALQLRHPVLGAFALPLERLHSLEVLGVGQRWLLDNAPRHVGDDFRADFDPPAPEGALAEWTFDWDGPVDQPLELLLDVVDVVGEDKSLQLSEYVRDGMRAYVSINDQPLDNINRHIATRNEIPARVRIQVPPGTLRQGPNTLLVRQTGPRDDPNNLDDWLLLQILLQTPAPDPGA